ncbi:succinyl-diaminopimelate desuccinylase [Euzebya tangerina]|uniref:succinyl-diaminopimelate desuccinylase n=1 Tax=Euzebya tangerina TaxID=591198 RepID=UPI000E31F32E|nr:succinyl-diaminopimelate desuccinylase [Euzebya tangerina]
MNERNDLAELLLELCSMPCVTGEEGPIADWLADRYASRGDVVMRVANSVVAAPPEQSGDTRPTVLLVSHIDVVPPTDLDREPRIEGDRVVGRGTSDMKAGMAVSMDVFEDSELRDGPYRLVLIGYAGEEGPHDGNELRQVLEAAPGLTDASLAVVLEPTDLEVQLGCMGSLHAEVTIQGQAAHSARPWHGDNAVTKAGEWLTEVRTWEPEDIVVDDLTYREVAGPTGAWTTNARNVIPGEFTVSLNYRFAPDKDAQTATEAILARIGDVGPVEVLDIAPACPPERESPAVKAFTAAAGAVVAPKQAWTDVARFAEVGVPALNYGPGLTAQAHQAGEYVPIANLQPARDALARFLG